MENVFVGHSNITLLYVLNQFSNWQWYQFGGLQNIMLWGKGFLIIALWEWNIFINPFFCMFLSVAKAEEIFKKN